jgi:hypothetical protein
MVFEVLGHSLLSLIKFYDYHGIPMPMLRDICRQILIALDFLHTKCSIIHTDLKPENVLMTRWGAPELSYELVDQVRRARVEKMTNGTTKLTKSQKAKLRKKLKAKQGATPTADDPMSTSGTGRDDDDEQTDASDSKSLLRVGTNSDAMSVVTTDQDEERPAALSRINSKQPKRPTSPPEMQSLKVTNFHEPMLNGDNFSRYFFDCFSLQLPDELFFFFFFSFSRCQHFSEMV